MEKSLFLANPVTWVMRYLDVLCWVFYFITDVMIDIITTG